MFASLKSKIKEETGSDITKLTSSWRAGAFLSRISPKDESTTTTTSPSSSGGQGDFTSESISPQMESYLSERTGGHIDQSALQLQYTAQLEAKLLERDAMWEKKMEELKLSQASVQGEEAAAAQTVARAAQAEAARAAQARQAAERQLADLRARLCAAERAQDRLDEITEELEQSQRKWVRERSELTAALGEAEARARDLRDEAALVRAALPSDNPLHHLHEDDRRELPPSGCAQHDRVCRERAVLARQLTETKMALADVKTSWSGQIASLETQVARLSRQAGEEGAERRRVEDERRQLLARLAGLEEELEKTKQSLVNSEAKVVRLNSEAHSLAMEVKALRGAADHVAERTMEVQQRLAAALEHNEELRGSMEDERTLVKILQEKVEKSTRLYEEQRAQANRLETVITELQHDCLDMQRRVEKEAREKDEALLRNAHMSQSLELSQCELRYQETEVNELKTKMAELETLLAEHKENQAACMVIKEAEAARRAEVADLTRRVEQLAASEAALQETVLDLQTQICDKNKKIKTLDNRISDMKKTLQRELQSCKSELTSAEEQDISRRYLKHVILRFLTARELEARQLTRALAALLRLTEREEAMLQERHARHNMSWLSSLANTSSIL